MAVREACGAVGGPPKLWLAWNQHDAARYVATSQFSHYFIRLSEGARGYLAVKLSSRCHREHATQIFACANR